MKGWDHPCDTVSNLLIVTKHRKILKKGVVVKLDGASLDGADQIRLRPISVLHLARLHSPRRSNQNGGQSVDISGQVREEIWEKQMDICIQSGRDWISLKVWIDQDWYWIGCRLSRRKTQSNFNLSFPMEFQCPESWKVGRLSIVGFVSRRQTLFLSPATSRDWIEKDFPTHFEHDLAIFFIAFCSKSCLF